MHRRGSHERERFQAHSIYITDVNRREIRIYLAAPISRIFVCPGIWLLPMLKHKDVNSTTIQANQIHPSFGANLFFSHKL